MTMFWWGAAFYPAAGEALPRFQSVCFGIQSGGLPETYGWINLIGGPLLLLSFLLLSWGDEIPSSFRYLIRTSFGKSVAVLIVICFALEAVWVALRIADLKASQWVETGFDPSLTLPDSYPRSSKDAPPFELVDQMGGVVNLGSFQGRPFLLTFAFAHCQTICPMIIKNATSALDQAGSGASLVVVTLDPWRDTPATLPHLARDWELPGAVHLLSGKVEDVNAMLDAYKVPHERDEKSGNITHPALVYVIDGEGKIAYSFNNPSPTWMADALSRVSVSK